MLNKRSYTYKLLNQIKKVLLSPSFRYIVIGLIMGYMAFNLVGGQKDAIISTSIYFIAALGFTLLLGYAGLASLGTAGFMSLGVYVYGILAEQDILAVPLPIAMLLVLASSLILGLIIGFISLRIEGVFLAIVTLGLSEIVLEIMKNLARMLRGVDFFKLDNQFLWFNTRLPIYSDIVKYMVIVIVVITMIIIANIMKSSSGRAMLSLKNSQSAGQAMGMGLLKYRLFAFVLSTFLATLAGILFMSYYNYSQPSDWGLTKSLLILAAVVIGGAKSIVGVLLGTFTVFTIDSLFLQNITFFRENSNFISIFTGALIIVIVMFFPGGLYHLGLIIKYRSIEYYNKLKSKIKSRQIARKEKRYGKDEEYRPFEAII